jgi:hypothetical protein
MQILRENEQVGKLVGKFRVSDLGSVHSTTRTDQGDSLGFILRAGEGIRTLDVHLGKVKRGCDRRSLAGPFPGKTRESSRRVAPPRDAQVGKPVGNRETAGKTLGLHFPTQVFPVAFARRQPTATNEVKHGNR